MLQGQELRRRSLSTASGRPLTLRVIRPEPTTANIAALRGVSDKWRAEAKALPRGSPARFHATFASDVAFVAARDLHDSNRRILVGLDDAGDVLGIVSVLKDPGGRDWTYSLQTATPRNQPSNPNPDKVRGVGNEMTGAALALMTSELCADVRLHCLDEAACAHWRNVGFIGPDPNLGMTCSAATLAAQRYANTPQDKPDEGEDTSVADDLEELEKASLEPDDYTYFARMRQDVRHRELERRRGPV